MTVQVWRFATWRSGSLRRVATRSPSPICSPLAVVTTVVAVACQCSVVADGGVQVRDLLARIGDDEVTGGAGLGEGCGSFDFGGVDHDLTAAMEVVEDARPGRRRCASAGSARRSRGR